jgi:tetratricopeptide (TPR) repeat protein
MRRNEQREKFVQSMSRNRLKQSTSILIVSILAAMIYVPCALAQGAGAEATPTPKPPARERVRSRARVRRVRPPVAGVIRKPQAVNLLITTSPANCDVFINDDWRGTTNANGNFEIELTPDDYTLRLAKNGFETIEKDFVVERGQEEQELPPFKLDPKLQTLKITTDPAEAEVYLDDAYKGVSNKQGLLLVEKVNPKQSHQLRAKREGYEEKTQTVDADKLEDTIKLTPRLTTLRVLTEPEAEVYLDEVYKGTSNAEGVLLIEQVNLRQEHKLRARKEGFTTETIPVPLEKAEVPVPLKPAPSAVSLNEVKQRLADDRLADALRAYGQLAALKPDHPELPRLLDTILQRLQARSSKLMAQVEPYGVAVSAEQAAEMYDLYEQAGKWQRNNPAHEGVTAYWDMKRLWTRARTRVGRERDSLLLNAGRAAQRLRALNLRDPLVNYDLGWLYKELGDADSAVKAYNEAQTLNTGWAYPLFALASIDMSTAEKEVAKATKNIYYQRAIEGLSKAINLKPNFPAAYALRCIAYAVINRHLESIPSGQQAVALKPDSAYTHYALGFAYFQKGYHKDKQEYRNALEEFDKALTYKEDELDEGTKESIRQKLFLMRRALGIKPSGN